jgi:hypothetical protein
LLVATGQRDFRQPGHRGSKMNGVETAKRPALRELPGMPDDVFRDDMTI